MKDFSIKNTSGTAIALKVFRKKDPNRTAPKIFPTRMPSKILENRIKD